MRLVLYGFFTVSASVGLVIALAQLPGGLANAPGALPTKGTLEVRLGSSSLLTISCFSYLGSHSETVLFPAGNSN